MTSDGVKVSVSVVVNWVGVAIVSDSERVSDSVVVS